MTIIHLLFIRETIEDASSENGQQMKAQVKLQGNKVVNTSLITLLAVVFMLGVNVYGHLMQQLEYSCVLFS